MSITRNCSADTAATGVLEGGSAFRFFGIGTLPLDPLWDGRPWSSVALRLLDGFCALAGLLGLPERLPAPPALGLTARLFVTGLVARLLRGLLPRLILFVFGLGIFGLVARFATTECPPRWGVADGEVAREPAPEFAWGREGPGLDAEG